MPRMQNSLLHLGIDSRFTQRGMLLLRERIISIHNFEEDLIFAAYLVNNYSVGNTAK
jgi:hypothetical protein